MIISKKKWTDLESALGLLYRTQQLQAQQLSQLLAQVSTLNAKVLTDAQPQPAPVVQDNQTDADRVLGSGQDGSPDQPR